MAPPSSQRASLAPPKPLSLLPRASRPISHQGPRLLSVCPPAPALMQAPQLPSWTMATGSLPVPFPLPAHPHTVMTTFLQLCEEPTCPLSKARNGSPWLRSWGKDFSQTCKPTSSLTPHDPDSYTLASSPVFLNGRSCLVRETSNQFSGPHSGIFNKIEKNMTYQSAVHIGSFHFMKTLF